ncbi:MAG: MFS transporter [Brevinema sp.]
MTETTDSSLVIRKFGFKDQLGYALGDLANGMFFMLTASYLTLFYVDVLGIGVASVGILLLSARIWDAINDPLIGACIDRQPPHPKYGKFRPWILYMIFPVVLFGVLTFSVFPGLAIAPIHVKLLYAYITYIGFGMSYTAINIPYGSLASTITDDETERATLSMFRSYGAIGASLIINTLFPLLVFDSNRKPTAEGFFKLVLILAFISVVCYYLCNKLIRERIIVSRTEDRHQNMIQTLKSITRNRPLLVQMLVGVLSLTLFLIQGTLAPYLFKDYFQNIRALSINALLPLIGILVVSPFIKGWVAKYGKKRVTVCGTIVYTIPWFFFLLFPITSIPIYFTLVGIATLGITALTLLTWAFIPDCIDYQEYQTGIREEGTIYAIYSFARKVGQALAGFLGAYMLIWVGYSANIEVQSPETIQSIKFFVALLPIITGTSLSLLIHFGYNLDKVSLDHITATLRSRRLQK